MPNNYEQSKHNIRKCDILVYLLENRWHKVFRKEISSSNGTQILGIIRLWQLEGIDRGTAIKMLKLV